MDARAKRHYVSAANDHVRIPALRLLILLSALITGLSGLIAGQPAVARAGEPAAIAAAFAGRIEQADDVAQARSLPGADASDVETRDEIVPAAASFVPQTHPVDERRIE